MMWLTLVLQLAVVDFDKRPLFGEFSQFAPVELDGNHATREWLSYDIAGNWRNWFRVITIREDGTPCKGPRFNPWPEMPSFFNAAQAFAVRVDGVHDRLVVQTSATYREYHLEVPSTCQPF